MITQQIKDPNCLILMVTPANQDSGNSETVQLARHSDPTLERTLCVITKADLVEEGFAHQIVCFHCKKQNKRRSQKECKFLRSKSK